MTDANQSDAVVVPEQDAALMAAAEEALKPCPFCEGVARIVEDSDPKYPWAVWSCHQADCFLMHSNINRHRSYETEAEAIAAWNTRAEQAKPSASCEEVERALTEGLHLAVLTLAFHGRDRGTSRQEKMLDGLEELARKADPVIRAAITALRAAPEDKQP